MKSETANKPTASRRREYPKPTLWAEGITRRDRLFLWWLAYRAPIGYDFSDEAIQEACRKCRYPHDRPMMLERDYPAAWNRMLVKRACHLHRMKDPRCPNDPQSTYWRVREARQTNIKCRHPRLARKRGLQYYGKPLRKRRKEFPDVHARARAREAELPYEASMPEWRPIPECARPLPPAARRACEHAQGESGGLHGFGGVHSDW